MYSTRSIRVIAFVRRLVLIEEIVPLQTHCGPLCSVSVETPSRSSWWTLSFLEKNVR